MELKVVRNQIILSGPVIGDEPGQGKRSSRQLARYRDGDLAQLSWGKRTGRLSVVQPLQSAAFARQCQVIAILRARECFSAAAVVTLPMIILPESNISAFTGITIGWGISTPISCINTVYTIGQLNTAMVRETRADRALDKHSVQSRDDPFFPSGLVKRDRCLRPSCVRGTRVKRSVFACEPIAKTALDLGIIRRWI